MATSGVAVPTKALFAGLGITGAAVCTRIVAALLGALSTRLTVCVTVSVTSASLGRTKPEKTPSPVMSRLCIVHTPLT